jgi:SpoVK/Ycf46/Vps4 family AAA+-type ATPase
MKIKIALFLTFITFAYSLYSMEQASYFIDSDKDGTASPEGSLEDFAEELPQEITDTIYTLNDTDSYKKKFGKVPNLLILYGPSDTAKTSVVEIIAAQTKRPCIEVGTSLLLCKDYIERIQEIRKAFERVRQLKKPCIILINKLDLILSENTITVQQRHDLASIFKGEIKKDDPLVFCIGIINNFWLFDEITMERYRIECVKVPLLTPTLIKKELPKDYSSKLDIKSDIVVTEQHLLQAFEEVKAKIFIERKKQPIPPCVSKETKASQEAIQSTNTDDDYAPSERFTYFEDLPSLNQLFTGHIDPDIQNLISTLRNPSVLKGEYVTNLNLGLLLYGPPGTGKNSIAQNIIRESYRDLVYKSGGRFETGRKGSGAKSVLKLFEEAVKKARAKNNGAIIFIENIEGLASTPRTEDQNLTLSSLKSAMHCYKDDPDIFVIATTNAIRMLDNSIRKYFHSIYIGLPDKEARKAILLYYLQKAKIKIIQDKSINLSPTTDFDALLKYFDRRAFSSDICNKKVITSSFLDLIVSITEGFSGRELESVIDLATVRFKFNTTYRDQNKPSEESLLSIAKILNNMMPNKPNFLVNYLSTIIPSLKFVQPNSEKTKENGLAILDHALTLINLQADPIVYWNSLLLLTQSVAGMTPMERHIYEETIHEVYEILDDYFSKIVNT